VPLQECPTHVNHRILLAVCFSSVTGLLLDARSGGEVEDGEGELDESVDGYDEDEGLLLDDWLPALPAPLAARGPDGRLRLRNQAFGQGRVFWPPRTARLHSKQPHWCAA
jgi:hypothetical protein